MNTTRERSGDISGAEKDTKKNAPSIVPTSEAAPTGSRHMLPLVEGPSGSPRDRRCIVDSDSNWVGE
jgi:hypothetical protein